MSSIDWCRLWHDMPTDPKFRAVAKRAGRPTSEVLAIFAAMMVNASANEKARGTLRNWSHEDMAVALDIEPEHAEAIYNAMQGKLLNGDELTGWDRRQPKREDGSAERAKEWRERNRTQANGKEQKRALEKEKEEDTEKKVEVQSRANATPVAALPDRFVDRMIEAAGDCLANPCNAQGLITEATPMMWLEGGCDLERDILPTLRAAAVARKGKQIRTWSYFTNMVAEAKAKRLAGLPAVDVKKSKPPPGLQAAPRHREISASERERIALEMEAMH